MVANFELFQPIHNCLIRLLFEGLPDKGISCQHLSFENHQIRFPIQYFELSRKDLRNTIQLAGSCYCFTKGSLMSTLWWNPFSS